MTTVGNQKDISVEDVRLVLEDVKWGSDLTGFLQNLLGLPEP
jgi:hypothetical protein